MSQLKVNSVVDASGGNTSTINSMTPTADSLQGFRNRIINGSMMIDQRNAGSSVTPASPNQYTLDRWKADISVSSKYSAQQSSTAPTGFVNSLLITSLSAYTVGSAERFCMTQNIEGLNVPDLAWGTANAKTITLSFWVRSSLTGTFGGVISNSAQNRSYPFTYTISSANTFEQKTITITGDTSGTWLTTSGIGLRVIWGLGVGSTLSTTAGAWAAGEYYSATGATSVVGTNGATWYMTGAQLEVGSVATPFERRDYGRELAMCYRYFYKYENTTGGATPLTVWQVYATTSAFGSIFTFPVVMRATPTATTSGTFLCYNAAGSSALNFTAFNVDRMTPYTAGSNGSNVASGLVVGDATVVYAPNNGSISLTAEL
jgi:hypothetical protein